MNDLTAKLFRLGKVDAMQVEQLRVQLAGCSVAACGGNKGPQACKRGDWGWSRSFEDASLLYDRWTSLRQEFDKLFERHERLRAEVKRTDRS